MACPISTQGMMNEGMHALRKNEESPKSKDGFVMPFGGHSIKSRNCYFWSRWRRQTWHISFKLLGKADSTILEALSENFK